MYLKQGVSASHSALLYVYFGDFDSFFLVFLSFCWIVLCMCMCTVWLFMQGQGTLGFLNDTCFGLQYETLKHTENRNS